MDVDNEDLKSAPINLMEVVVMMMATKLLHRLIGEQLRRLLLHLFDGEDEEEPKSIGFLHKTLISIRRRS
jgi:hypothetical protein